jgi:hypothetical protein
MSVARDVQQVPPRLKDLLFHFELTRTNLCD